MYDEREQFEKEEANMQEVNKQGLPSTNLKLYLAFSQKLFAIAKQVFLSKAKRTWCLLMFKLPPKWKIGKTNWFSVKNKFDSLLLAL
jgi:hypothetical protein